MTLKQYKLFLEERIRLASSTQSKSAYVICLVQAKKIDEFKDEEEECDATESDIY